jgi:hypothetical protein|tara:strand:+ start:1715 stop:1819 length:105 start_codon:yes stop_codon:yes gene_type:complete
MRCRNCRRKAVLHPIKEVCHPCYLTMNKRKEKIK